MRPSLSIIMPSYNKEAFIGEAIASVKAQDFQDWELLIVDDASTDSTVEAAGLAARGDERIQISGGILNQGANWCRNEGTRLSNGKYLIFFDADDLFAPGCFSQRVKKMENNPNLDFCVFTMQVFRRRPGDGDSTWVPRSSFPLRDFFAHTLPWQTMQPVWRSEAVRNIGGFDESFYRLQDVEFHTRALLQDKISYDLVPGVPDCYFRIAEERKNFDNYSFMSRWTEAAIQYCTKFRDVASADKKYLVGTIHETYIQLLYSLKKKMLTREEFDQLEKKLLDHSLVRNNGFKLSLLRTARVLNLSPVRIKGANWLMKKALIHSN